MSNWYTGKVECPDCHGECVIHYDHVNSKGETVDWPEQCYRCGGSGWVSESSPTEGLTCQVLSTRAPWGSTRHLVVERDDGKDGITWEQLQAAKDEALGPDVVAVEVYPAAGDVVNEVNRRHLWEVPSDLLAGLTLRRGS